MRNSLLLCLALISLFFTSCRKDFEFETNPGGLLFSKDTVYLDTVFTNIGSSTYTLKVYNKTNKDINIPSIKLAKGLNSKYRITVDGMIGNNNRIFENVELLAKDSMYIFIETTVDFVQADPASFLYTDQIEFSNASPNVQKVELVTLIQDAYFLYPKKFSDGTTETLPIGNDEIYGFLLDENDPVNGNELNWTNAKPYVIYGYGAVPSNKTLNIQAGTKVHFHNNSGLIVSNNASIKANGIPPINALNPLENQIIFAGDRLEPFFENVPGQWGTIWFTQGSKENILNNIIIKNATVGLLVSGNTNLTNPLADITLNNVQIYNSSNSGILARTGYITGSNVVINSAGQASLACTYGGKYNFIHSTFNNTWQSSKQVSVLLNNYIEGAIPETQQMVEANFKNCIIYGSNQLQMLIDKKGTNLFNYNFNSCFIKFNNIDNQYTNNPLYQFLTDVVHYNSNIIATNSSTLNPNFLNVPKNKLNIGANSAIKGLANFSFSNGLNDILNNPRTNPSDIGAYNFVTFN